MYLHLTCSNNKGAILLYLTNCARLLAAVASITWQASSQHPLRLGCPLLGHHQLPVPKQSQHSSACTCECPSSFLTPSLSQQQSSSVDPPTPAPNSQSAPLSSNSAVSVSPFFLSPCSSSSFFSAPPSHSALDSFSVIVWAWDTSIYKKQLSLMKLFSPLCNLKYIS